MQGQLSVWEGLLKSEVDIYISITFSLCTQLPHLFYKRFQRFEYAKLEIFKTDKKGFGVRTLEDLKPNQLVIEYCGEVIPKSLFLKRTQEYSLSGMKHFYFMSLKSDEVRISCNIR